MYAKKKISPFGTTVDISFEIESETGSIVAYIFHFFFIVFTQFHYKFKKGLVLIHCTKTKDRTM